MNEIVLRYFDKEGKCLCSSTVTVLNDAQKTKDNLDSGLILFFQQLEFLEIIPKDKKDAHK